MTNESVPNNGKVSLKEYLSRRMDDLEKRIQTIFDMNAVAIDKAEKRMDTRLEGMNEFRDQLRDQASRFITRVEFDALMEKLNASVKSLELTRATLEGKASQQGLIITAIISTISLLVSITGLILRLSGS